MATNENFDLDLQDEDAEDFVVNFGEVTNASGGTSNFNDLSNRPKYDGQMMTGETDIPKAPTKTSDLTNDSDYQTGTEVAGAIDSAIGELNIPTKTSDLENDGEDGSSVYIEADELASVATSGSYNDLDNKPTIPTVNDATLTITQNGTSKGTFTANDADDTTIEVSDTTYSNFTGTDGLSAGTSGLVPAPATTDAGKFLKADGTWDTAGGGGSSVTTLTSADFNYPVNNPDGIAMWLLPDGDYVTTLTSDYIYPDNGASKQLFRYFSKVTEGNSAIIYYIDSDNVWKYWSTNKNTGARISFGRMAPRVQQSSGTSQTDVMSQDATTKLVDGRVKQNAGAPTTSTVGTVGQLYEDTTNGKLYQCTAVSGSTYTWAEVGAGGGGGVTPVQTTGTSTTDVMSQDATTKMVYSKANPSTYAQGGAIYLGNLNTNQEQQSDPALTDRGWKYFWALPSDNTTQPVNNSVNILGKTNKGNTIVIGGNSVGYGNNGAVIGGGAEAGQQSVAIGAWASAGKTGANISSMIAIGGWAQADVDKAICIGGGGSDYGIRNSTSTSSVALGYKSTVGGGSNGYKNAVALGAYSSATRQGEVNVGLVTGETTGGFNNTAYRVIGGVHDGQTDHDVATVGQINATIDAINTALSTNIPHIGA